MLSAGVSPKAVQETLDHSTFGLTMDTFTSVFTEASAAAAEAAGALVRRAVGGTAGHTLSTSARSSGSAGEGIRGSGGGPRGDRTHNPRIKRERVATSPSLYQRRQLHDRPHRDTQAAWFCHSLRHRARHGLPTAETLHYRRPPPA